jgi:hypothetical protein
MKFKNRQDSSLVTDQWLLCGGILPEKFRGRKEVSGEVELF